MFFAAKMDIDGAILPSFAFVLTTFDSHQQEAKLVGPPPHSNQSENTCPGRPCAGEPVYCSIEHKAGFLLIAMFETFQGFFPPLRLTMRKNTSALKRLEHKLSKRGAGVDEEWGCRFGEGQKVGKIWWLKIQ